jgi:hypothetical protein
MNMRNHSVILMGGGVCAVLLLAALIFLFRALSDYQAQGRTLDRQYQRLAELDARQPFPSPENVAQERKNLEGFEYHAEELLAVLSRDPFPEDAADAADFSARAQDVIEQFQKRTTDAGVQIPGNLEAGFAEYASGGAIPELSDVPRLSRQLSAVEKVADILVRCSVDSIEILTRDLFEQQSDPFAEEKGRRGSRRGVTAKPPKDIRKIASVVQPEGLYTIERVGTTFVATEQVAWAVFEELAAVPHFMVAADLEHATLTSVLTYNPDSTTPSDSEKEFLPGGILSGRTALSRPERIIAGNERVRISLQIDVYNFESGTPGALP